MTIDARTQGCFCEVLGEGAGVVHLTVTFVNPGVILRLSGGLGPLGLMYDTGAAQHGHIPVPMHKFDHFGDVTHTLDLPKCVRGRIL